MSVFMNALYMILLKWKLHVSECALQEIIKMRADMCLNAIYTI